MANHQEETTMIWRREAIQRSQKMEGQVGKFCESLNLPTARQWGRHIQEQTWRDVNWMINKMEDIQGQWNDVWHEQSNSKFMLRIMKKCSVWDELVSNFMDSTCPSIWPNTECGQWCCIKEQVIG